MSAINPNGPTEAGVVDQNNTATGVVEVHAEDAVAISANDGTPLKQQVVQVESKRGIAQIIVLLASIDRRLARIETEQFGFPSDE